MTRPRPRPTRRAFLSGAGGLALAGPALARRTLRDDTEGRPNVLFITADQHRFDVAGFAGNAHAHTPSLDRLAREGTRITDMYCQAPLCVPARQSLVTGRYAHDHGSFANWLAFPEGQATVAGALAEAGYDTAFFGKTHANTAGFAKVVERGEMYRDFRAAHPRSVVPGKVHRRGRQERNSFKLHQMNPGMLPPGEKGVSVFHMEESVVTGVERFLKGRVGEAPFFVWASFLAPHPPFYPPEPWLARFRKAELPFHAPLSEEEASKLPERERAQRESIGLDAVTPEEMLGITRSYYASVAWADDNVGRLLAFLDEAGLAEDTLVVYTSDHGEMLGEHGLMFKQSFFEGAARVPCILRLPSRIQAGRTLPNVAQHVDLIATLLEALGVERASVPGLAGVSMWPHLAGMGGLWAERALSEMVPNELLTDEVDGTRAIEGAELQQMLRIGRYKYARYGAGDELLFDLETDPGETRNLIGDPELEERRGALIATLSTMTPETVTTRGPDESRER